MNERIQELAYQAEDYADYIVDQGGEFHPAYTQKLAELIVKECAMVVEGFEVTVEVALDEYMDYEAGAVLKEHFGVI